MAYGTELKIRKVGRIRLLDPSDLRPWVLRGPEALRVVAIPCRKDAFTL